MGRTACTEPPCLYKGALYFFTYFEFVLCVLPSNVLVHISVKVFSVNFGILTTLCPPLYYFTCVLLSYISDVDQKWPKHVADDHFIYIYIYIVLKSCSPLQQTQTLGKWPTRCTIILYNTFIIVILYMFRATLCSSSGGQIVLIQDLV